MLVHLSYDWIKALLNVQIRWWCHLMTIRTANSDFSSCRVANSGCSYWSYFWKGRRMIFQTFIYSCFSDLFIFFFSLTSSRTAIPQRKAVTSEDRVYNLLSFFSRMQHFACYSQSSVLLSPDHSSLPNMFAVPPFPKILTSD